MLCDLGLKAPPVGRLESGLGGGASVLQEPIRRPLQAVMGDSDPGPGHGKQG